MSEQYGNKVYSGRKGKMWINDKRYTNCYNYELNMAFEYEELLDPEGFGKIQIPGGYALTGTITLKRDGSEDAIIEALVEAGMKNVLPNISIVGNMTTNDEKNANRYRIDGVTFDSVQIQKFAKDAKVIDLELPFKARRVAKI